MRQKTAGAVASAIGEGLAPSLKGVVEASVAAGKSANKAGAASAEASRYAFEAGRSSIEAHSAADYSTASRKESAENAAEARGDAENSRIMAAGFLAVIDAFYKFADGDATLAELNDSRLRARRILRMLTGEFACAENDANALALTADTAEREATEAAEFADTLEAIAVSGSTASGVQAIAARQAADTAATEATEWRSRANAAYVAADAADKAHDPALARASAQAVVNGGEFEPVADRPDYPPAEAKPEAEPVAETEPEAEPAEPNRPHPVWDSAPEPGKSYGSRLPNARDDNE